jgi:hypothetical protein
MTDKTTDTLSKYMTLIAFHCKNSYTKAPQCHDYTHVACLVTVGTVMKDSRANASYEL